MNSDIEPAQWNTDPNEQDSVTDTDDTLNAFHFRGLNQVLDKLKSADFDQYWYDDKLPEFFVADGKLFEKSVEIKVHLSFHQDEKSFIMMFTDTTQRDLIARTEDKNQFKSNILRSISHELKTPVNGYLCLLEDCLRDDEIPINVIEDKIRPAVINSKKLLYFIDDIIDLSHFQTNDLQMNYQQFFIRDVIAEMIELCEPMAKLKKIELDFEQDSRSPERIVSDQKRLSQVLLNLVGNALKFTTVGRVLISIRLDQQDLSQIKFSIKDTGVGMSTEQLARLRVQLNSKTGDIGERVSNSSTGAGFGLWISNKISNMLGKPLEIKSNLGSGSEFTFTIQNRLNAPSTMDAMSSPSHKKAQQILRARSSRSLLNLSNSQYQPMLSQKDSYNLDFYPSPSPDRNRTINEEDFQDISEQKDNSIHTQYGDKSMDLGAGRQRSSRSIYNSVRDNLLNEEVTRNTSDRGEYNKQREQQQKSPYDDNNKFHIKRLFTLQKKNSLKSRRNSDSIASFEKQRTLQADEILDKELELTRRSSARGLHEISKEQLSKFRTSRGKSVSINDKRKSIIITPAKIPTYKGEDNSGDAEDIPEILIVDDDPFNLNAFEAMLLKMNVTVDKAFNGRVAVEKIKEKCLQGMKGYDLCFMDCNMPEMDGYEATTLLKTLMLKGEIIRFPIIACTAFTGKQNHQKCIECGMDGYMPKPINPAQIKKTLDDYGVLKKDEPDEEEDELRM